MDHPPTIECRPNGPYIVKGVKDLRNSRGESLPNDAPFALCRCGASANKPFCDSTHKSIGFSGARLTDGSADRRDDYRGSRITIHDNRGICAHSAICTDRLAPVFKYGEEPWIDPQGAEAAAIIAAINACPSGALAYSVEGEEPALPARPPVITVTRDGPYAVVGGIALVGVPRAEGASTERYTLCRCGASKNKPFCDGSHYDAKFSDGKN